MRSCATTSLQRVAPAANSHRCMGRCWHGRRPAFSRKQAAPNKRRHGEDGGAAQGLLHEQGDVATCQLDLRKRHAFLSSHHATMAGCPTWSHQLASSTMVSQMVPPARCMKVPEQCGCHERLAGQHLNCSQGRREGQAGQQHR